MPKDGGSPTTGINFRVMDKKGDFVLLKDTKCGDDIEKKFVSCRVPMAKLFTKPYNVDPAKFVVF